MSESTTPTTVRLREAERKELERLRAEASARAGVDVTLSQIAREALRRGLALMVKDSRQAAA